MWGLEKKITITSGDHHNFWYRRYCTCRFSRAPSSRCQRKVTYRLIFSLNIWRHTSRLVNYARYQPWGPLSTTLYLWHLAFISHGDSQSIICTCLHTRLWNNIACMYVPYTILIMHTACTWPKGSCDRSPRTNQNTDTFIHLIIVSNHWVLKGTGRYCSWSTMVNSRATSQFLVNTIRLWTSVSRSPELALSRTRDVLQDVPFTSHSIQTEFRSKYTLHSLHFWTNATGGRKLHLITLIQIWEAIITSLHADQCDYLAFKTSASYW